MTEIPRPEAESFEPGRGHQVRGRPPALAFPGAAGERVLLPYATTVLGHYPDNPVAALLFGLVFGLILASRAAIQTLAGRDDEVLHPEADRHQHR